MMTSCKAESKFSVREVYTVASIAHMFHPIEPPWLVCRHPSLFDFTSNSSLSVFGHSHDSGPVQYDVSDYY